VKEKKKSGDHRSWESKAIN